MAAQAAAQAAAKVVPAQLAFLAIYNPCLGRTDETFRDQLVFYYSKNSRPRRRDDAQPADAHDDSDDINEQLRQIGLAQGVVNFAQSFSEGEPVDHVDTEKSRIVLCPLEGEWWVLASIDLTRLPASQTSAKSPTDTSASTPPQAIEYSSREVSPPDLLLKQIQRAHRVFRLHHGPSLSDLFARLTRTKFCNILDNFWSRFARTWEVLLHGNPATDIYGGIKLAAGGELGMGVGEEEWGSGERDVFEDFTARTDGLVDMVVSRFGEPAAEDAKNASEQALADADPWLGMGREPETDDGVIFSGIGAITRPSLRDVSAWTQWVYTYGERAYGVRDNPNSDRKRRRRRNNASKMSNNLQSPTPRGNGHAREQSEGSVPSRSQQQQKSKAPGLPPGIPPPIVTAVENSLDEASTAADASQEQQGAGKSPSQGAGYGDTLMNYLTLGYGSSWGAGLTSKKSTPPPPSGRPQEGTQNQKQHEHDEREKPDQAAGAGMQHLEPQPDVDPREEAINTQIRRENIGHFLVGLQGDLDNEEPNEDEVMGLETDASIGSIGGGDYNRRIMLRTLHVKVQKPSASRNGDSSNRNSNDNDGSSSDTIAELPPQPAYEKLRVVVYVHRPFIFTFLFTNRTEVLSYAAFYRHIHTFLAPMYKPLALSTSPARVAARIAAAADPYTTAAASSQPIFDLVYDPLALSVHSSIPSIPEPGTLGAEGLAGGGGGGSGHWGGGSGRGGASGYAIGRGGGARGAPVWTRVEALNTHAQILATVASARRTPADVERTAKTNRGWWLVWMRLPPSRAVEAEACTTCRDGSSDAGAGVGVEKEKEKEKDTRTEEAVRSLHLSRQLELDGDDAGASASETPFSAASTSTSPPPTPTPPKHNPPSSSSSPAHTNIPTALLREALLIRRSHSYTHSHSSSTSSAHNATSNTTGAGGSIGAGTAALWRLGVGLAGGGEGGWGNGGSGGGSGRGNGGGNGGRGVVEGVGVDARRYVEGLLSLSR
ncbi:uncharacterized protein K452DRAFT_297865 [Aplosporella prunicola CBS 121167]|uniref:CCZ1/INTU/HSP4 first Longin domain-containing protein n=1 Tax=Aplosporella prunicola CBS 121167 TaxID=1176127 RepID=A0A6A6BEL9_9PEZI|nr:uncharacterized protein K452DRAFT_297865 [Aplosporella prunicola CBS 121167]KAF2142609.1 hypothetical protein K452DRAFT_297865 [Aplosporella prunicola CBS 121167]